MALTNQSTGLGALKEMFQVKMDSADDVVIALAGNPNTGKSTVFNELTGLNQHTGNWPGKTVTNAQGSYRYKNKKFILVDLPGTYSLMANSVEEEVARDFICFGKPAVTVIVTDGTCLERNLNLVLQIMEITSKVVVCVNLLDEAKRKKISIALDLLSKELGVPVVGTSARNGKGIEELKEVVYQVAQDGIQPEPVRILYSEAIEKAIEMLIHALDSAVSKSLNSRWLALRLLDEDPSILEEINRLLGFRLLEDQSILQSLDEARLILNEKGICQDVVSDHLVSRIVCRAEELTEAVVTVHNKNYNQFDRKTDHILTSKAFGIPIMIGLLGIVFWLTVQGANYPSAILASFFRWIEEKLVLLFASAAIPDWIHGILVQGVYKTMAWVVSVMLPPMAIFFPLFTLLEDLGYLPRVAFNLDNFFKRACAHGKQALTMCMGFGCNAAGVIACRIIDSPRERLIAIITNNFVPCNGRFPTLIAMATIFIAGTSAFSSFFATLAVLGVIVFGVIMTLLVSNLLSKTILRGLPSSFTLELPPYRRPQVGKIILRSIVDRTLFVLGRAMMVAAPAGLIIWIMANINVNGTSLLSCGAALLQPLGNALGMDGYILMAFILGFPANEIVIPIVIMSYLSAGALLDLDSMAALKDLLISNGWTWLTALNVMIFTLLHFPCGTTLLTIRKETQSIKWAVVSFLIPTGAGILVCFLLTQIAKLSGLA